MSEMLERILSDENIKTAYKRVYATLSTGAINIISAYENDKNIEDLSVQNELAIIPEVLQNKIAQNVTHIKRLHENEDMKSIQYENVDGSKTLYLFSENIKYVDEYGAIRDKSNSIYSASDTKYAYETRDNDIKTLFSSNIVDGVIAPCSNGLNKQLTCNLSEGVTYWLIVQGDDMEYHKYG